MHMVGSSLGWWPHLSPHSAVNRCQSTMSLPTGCPKLGMALWGTTAFQVPPEGGDVPPDPPLPCHADPHSGQRRGPQGRRYGGLAVPPGPRLVMAPAAWGLWACLSSHLLWGLRPAEGSPAKPGASPQWAPVPPTLEDDLPTTVEAVARASGAWKGAPVGLSRAGRAPQAVHPPDWELCPPGPGGPAA